MERLTDNTEYCTSWSDCEMPEGKCVFLENCYDRKIYNRLREYEDAEEQGLLLRLPCKPGTIVCEIFQFLSEGAWEIEYHKLTIEDVPKIGKTVFLTKEEAEKALERMG